MAEEAIIVLIEVAGGAEAGGSVENSGGSADAAEAIGVQRSVAVETGGVAHLALGNSVVEVADIAGAGVIGGVEGAHVGSIAAEAESVGAKTGVAGVVA